MSGLVVGSSDTVQDLDFRILGPLDLLRDGHAVELGPRSQRSLLATLLLHANEVVSRERLIDEIWGQDPPASAANMVQVYVSRLRKALGPGLLLTQPPGYVLQVDEEQLDATRFAGLVARAGEAMRAGDPAGTRALLEQALGLWRGQPLADFAYESFAQGEVARLEELQLEALELRIDADLAMGRHLRLVGEIERLTALHPFRERLRGQLMLAKYRSGRQAEALEAYREAREVLVEELGIEPGTGLRRLQQAILTQDPDLSLPTREGAVAAERIDWSVTGNLSPELTSLIGRGPDVTRVADLISRHRLVAVVGPGGVGKTRLAQRVGGNLAPGFADGVWFVDLAAIDRGDDVAGAVLSATRISDRPGVTALDTLADELSGRRLLMLLDNCEHVIRSAAAVAGRLLKDCPGVRLLATSREPLAIAGERVARLEPLATTPKNSELPAAVELFLDRAATHGVSWEAPGSVVLGVIQQVCERLDGIPLAIELAAARTRAISPAELLARLDDRLRLLASPRRGSARARQDTLEAAIDWSYGLLSTEEQATLRRLAVFHGGFTLAAAVAACADIGVELDTLDRVTGLVDRSVITVERRRDGDRYRLLESIALFAGERLEEHGDAPSARDRHADFFSRLARETCNFESGGQATSGELLDAERDNMTAALRWCLDGDGSPSVGAGLAADIGRHWILRGRSNVANRWLKRALEPRDQVAPPTAAAVRVTYSWLAYCNSDLGTSRRSALEAVAIARETDDRDLLAEGLAQLACAYQGFGSETEAMAAAAELRSLQSSLSIRRARVMALIACAQVAFYTGDLEQAKADASSAREIARDAGDHIRAAWSGAWLAYALALGSAIPTARTAITEATQDAVRSGYELVIVDNMTVVTSLALADDDPEAALRMLPKVIETLREQQRWDDLGGRVRIAAEAELKRGFPERSAILLGAAEHWTDHVDVEDVMLVPELAGLRDQLSARLGVHAVDRAYEHGARLSVGDVVSLITSPELPF